MERKLNYIRNEIIKDELVLRELEPNEIPNGPNPPGYFFNNIEAKLDKAENEVTELSRNLEQLEQNSDGFVELRCVLENAQVI